MQDEILWDLFTETGDIEYYLCMKTQSGGEDENSVKMTALCAEQ